MLPELRRAEHAHREYTRSLFRNLHPAEVISKAHLLARCALQDTLRIRDLGADRLHQFGLRTLTFAGLGIFAFIVMTIVMMAMLTIGFFLDDSFNEDRFFFVIDVLFPWALVVLMAYLVDRISQHRAALTTDSREFRDALMALWNASAELTLCEDASARMAKALQRYDQALADYHEQTPTSWWSFVLLHKTDEVGLAKANLRLMGAADQYILVAKKAIEARCARDYLSKAEHFEATSNADLKTRLDAFWVKLTGRTYNASASTTTTDMLKDRGAPVVISAGVALPLTIIPAYLFGSAEVPGLLYGMLVFAAWAVFAAALYEIPTRHERRTLACLAWNKNEAQSLINDMAAVLLRDGHGQPAIEEARGSAVLGCLASMGTPSVEPTSQELSDAVHLMSQRFEASIYNQNESLR